MVPLSELSVLACVTQMPRGAGAPPSCFDVHSRFDRSNATILVAYSKAQSLWHDTSAEPAFFEYLELDLSTVLVLGTLLLVLVGHGGPLLGWCLGDAQHLPQGRLQAGDRHTLKFHETRDNLA